MQLRFFTLITSISFYALSTLFLSTEKDELLKTVKKHKAINANITLSVDPHSSYSGEGERTLVNGIIGSDKQFKDNQWLGFQGQDVEIVVDLKKKQTINTVEMRFFNAEKEWIYAPKAVYFLFSDNGKQYRGIQKVDIKRGSRSVVTMKQQFPKTKARYIKMMVAKYGKIPRGKRGAGKQAWTFLDEVQVW